LNASALIKKGNVSNYKIPSNVNKAKFLESEEFTADGSYKVLSKVITCDEFNDFIEANMGFPAKFTYFEQKLMVAIYQNGNEENSSIIHVTISELLGMIGMYNYSHDRITFGTGHSRQQVGNSFSREPDFGIAAMSRFRRNLIENSNIVGEVMYSQSLADGHRMVQQYLAPESEVFGVVLIDLEHPWPTNKNLPNTRRDFLPGKMVYYFYEKPESGKNQNIIPRNVVSFGTAPLNEFDIRLICETTGCLNTRVVGFRCDNNNNNENKNNIACDIHNQQIQCIPANCVLRHSKLDAQIELGEAVFLLKNVPRHFDMEVNLYQLQCAVLIGASYLKTNE
jgi:hypothetical protein